MGKTGGNAQGSGHTRRPKVRTVFYLGTCAHFRPLPTEFIFFGRFSATVTNSSWRNLEFFKKKILEFFWKFLEFIQKIGQFFPKFPEFSQFQALKLKFGQIFVQNISTSGLFWAKSQFLVGKLLSFWMICLNFFWLEFFGLELFSKCPKKACKLAFFSVECTDNDHCVNDVGQSAKPLCKTSVNQCGMNTLLNLVMPEIK